MTVNPANTTKVIPMVNLPASLKTLEMQNKYDLDGSGYIELVNSNGENEYDVFVSEYPLAKLYTRTGSVKCVDGANELYDENNQFVMKHDRYEGAREITYANGKTKSLNYEYLSDLRVRINTAVRNFKNTFSVKE